MNENMNVMNMNEDMNMIENMNIMDINNNLSITIFALE